MEKKITIILCTYNEVNYIEKTVNLIFKTFDNLELIIVDDNSIDGTLEKLNNLSSNFNFRFIVRKKTKGLASAINRGFMSSSGDYLGFFDCNSPDQMSHFKDMKKVLDDGYDIAILSRYINGGGDKRIFLRTSTSWFINLLCRIFLRVPIKDFSGGLFLMKKKILDDVTIIPYGHGEFFIEFVYEAYKKGFKIKELPYVQLMNDMTNSKSIPNLIHFFYLGFLYILRIFMTLFRRS